MKSPFRLLSWQAYKFHRFLQFRRSMYPGNLHSLVLPSGLDSVTWGFESHPTNPQVLVWNPSKQNLENLNLSRVPSKQDGIYLRSNEIDWLPQHGALLLDSRAAWAFGDWLSAPDPFFSPLQFFQLGLLFNIKVQEPLAAESLFLELEASSPPRLNLLADFFRDFYLSPWVCFLQSSGLSPRSSRLFDQIKQLVTQPGNVLYADDAFDRKNFSPLWVPSAYLHVVDSLQEAPPIPAGIPQNTLKVLIVLQNGELPTSIPSSWDLCLALGHSGQIPRLDKPWQGWVGSTTLPALMNLIDIRVHAHHCRQLIDFISAPTPPTRKITVIISTYRRPEGLRTALESLSRQTLAPDDFEVIVVNNEPQDAVVCQIIDSFHTGALNHPEYRLRQIDCPLTGLSFARNAAVANAKGEILCFLDDDAIAHPDWLEQIGRSFEQHAQAGVIGGHIRLVPPEPRPKVLMRGLERYWSELITPFTQYTEVENYMAFPWGANWCIRRSALLAIGGFRTQYGRRKRDFSGGEEIIAAGMVQKIGATVAILPSAQVDHHPEPFRYTFSYLLQTIQAQIVNHYRMNRDLYLPQTVSAKAQVKGIGRFILRLIELVKLPPSKRGTYAIEYYGTLLGWFRLFGERLTDTFARFWNRL